MVAPASEFVGAPGVALALIQLCGALLLNYIYVARTKPEIRELIDAMRPFMTVKSDKSILIGAVLLYSGALYMALIAVGVL